MKKLLFFTSLFISLCIIWSCSKYEEGPAFSLRTKTARLKNEWKLEEMLMNGNKISTSGHAYLDITKEDYIFITDNSSAKLPFGMTCQTGTWDFPCDDGEGDKLFFLSIDSSHIANVRIVRLKNNEFWFKWKYRKSIQQGTYDEYEYRYSPR